MPVAACARNTNQSLKQTVFDPENVSRETLRRQRKTSSEAAEISAWKAAELHLGRQQRERAKAEAARKFEGARGGVHRLIRAIAEEHGFTFEDLVGHSFTRRIVVARHHAIWEVRRQYSKSTVELGRYFGGRDHSSIINALNRWPEKAAKLGIPCEPLERRA